MVCKRPCTQQKKRAKKADRDLEEWSQERPQAPVELGHDVFIRKRHALAPLSVPAVHRRVDHLPQYFPGHLRNVLYTGRETAKQSSTGRVVLKTSAGKARIIWSSFRHRWGYFAGTGYVLEVCVGRNLWLYGRGESNNKRGKRGPKPSTKFQHK